jgi:hypothetical protein
MTATITAVHHQKATTMTHHITTPAEPGSDQEA